MDLSIVSYAFVVLVVIIFGLLYARVVWICADSVKRKYGFGELGWFVVLILLLNIPPLTLWVYLFMEDPPDSDRDKKTED